MKEEGIILRRNLDEPVQGIDLFMLISTSVSAKPEMFTHNVLSGWLEIGIPAVVNEDPDLGLIVPIVLCTAKLVML